MGFRIPGTARAVGLSGTVTGTYHNVTSTIDAGGGGTVGGTVGGGDDSKANSGGLGDTTFTASYMTGGISVGGAQADNSTNPAKIYLTLNVSISGPGGTSMSHRVDLGTADVGTKDYQFSYSASYSITATIEDWWDVGGVASAEFLDNGVLATELDLHGRLYQCFVEGSTITAQVGAASVTRTAGRGEDVGYGSAQVGAGGSFQYSPPTGGGDDTAPHSCSGSITGSGAYITFAGPSASGDGGSTETGGGASFTLTVRGGGSTNTHASVGAEMAPTVSGSVVGRVNAVDLPMAEAVTVRCPSSAVDPAPAFPATGGWSRPISQRQHRYIMQLNTPTETLIDSSDIINEVLSPTLDSAWCLAHGEYVSYPVEDDAGNVAIRRATDSAMRIHCFPFSGMTVSLPASKEVDDCTSAAGWAGAATGGGGLQNTGTGAMTRSFSPFSHWGAYRYLRLHVGSSAGPVTRTLTIGGKSWAVPVPATPADVLIDLCCPTSPTWTVDTQDTLWPDPNPTIGGGGGTAEGPGWGCTYVTGFSLSGFVAGETVTLSGVSLVRQSGLTADVMTEWAPRFSDASQVLPERTNDSGQTTTDKFWRGMTAMVDAARMSVELPSLRVSEVAGETVTYYIEDPLSVARVLDWLTATGVGGGAPPYQREPSGWAASTSLPPPDGSDELHDGFINDGLPFYFLYGAGLTYTDGGWQSGRGLDAGGGLSLPGHVLVTALSWTGMNDSDLFGHGGSGATGLVLPVSKILRAQATGAVLLTDGTGASGKNVEFYPGAGELQPSGTAVGSGTTATDGRFDTSGTGLIGYTTTGTDPSTSTGPSQGVLTDLSD